MTIAGDIPNERQHIYDEYRKDLLARHLSNSERYDRAILTLSTGALGLSITFIKDVVPITLVKDLYLLITSWWLFGVAIILTVISFAVSQYAIKVQLFFAQQYYLNGKVEYASKRNYAARTTDWLNNLSGIVFLVAVVLTIIFVSINFQGNADMTNQDRKSRAPFGAGIPDMPKVHSDEYEKRGAPIPDMPIIRPDQVKPDSQPTSEVQSGSTNNSQSESVPSDSNSEGGSAPVRSENVRAE